MKSKRIYVRSWYPNWLWEFLIWLGNVVLGREVHYEDELQKISLLNCICDKVFKQPKEVFSESRGRSGYKWDK